MLNYHSSRGNAFLAHGYGQVNRSRGARSILGTRQYALSTVGRRGETARRRLEVRGQRSEVRWLKVLNIEQQNKEPQNIEVKNITLLL